MNVPPVSVERVQKCVVNFEIYRFLKKKTANLPHPPLHVSVMGYYRFINFHQNRRWSGIFLGDCTWNDPYHKVFSKSRNSKIYRFSDQFRR